jgi:hypothetical protein
MQYSGKLEYAHQRKIRERNTLLYRFLHWPLWIWVLFLTPGPLTFNLFAHGFSRGNTIWLAVVLLVTGLAGVCRQLPGTEPRPYILRFDEERPNPLYRKVCYTLAWNCVLNYALLNLVGMIMAAFTGTWYFKQIYNYAYFPLCAVILLLGAFGKLPRVGRSTKHEGTERRYFYGSVWSVTISQTVLLIVWKLLPHDFGVSRAGIVFKLIVYVVMLLASALAASRGMLPRTRPILPGEVMISD